MKLLPLIFVITLASTETHIQENPEIRTNYAPEEKYYNTAYVSQPIKETYIIEKQHVSYVPTLSTQEPYSYQQSIKDQHKLQQDYIAEKSSNPQLLAKQQFYRKSPMLLKYYYKKPLFQPHQQYSYKQPSHIKQHSLQQLAIAKNPSYQQPLIKQQLYQKAPTLHTYSYEQPGVQQQKSYQQSSIQQQYSYNQPSPKEQSYQHLYTQIQLSGKQPSIQQQNSYVEDPIQQQYSYNQPSTKDQSSQNLYIQIQPSSKKPSIQEQNHHIQDPIEQQYSHNQPSTKEQSYQTLYTQIQPPSKQPSIQQQNSHIQDSIQQQYTYNQPSTKKQSYQKMYTQIQPSSKQPLIQQQNSYIPHSIQQNVYKQPSEMENHFIPSINQYHTHNQLSVHNEPSSQQFKEDFAHQEIEKPQFKILNYEYKNDDHSYHYNFESENGISMQEHGQPGKGNNVQGSYSYTGDDGKQYTVKYTADEHGFRPVGDHILAQPPVSKETYQSVKNNLENEANGINDDDHYQEEASQQTYQSQAKYPDMQSVSPKYEPVTFLPVEQK